MPGRPQFKPNEISDIADNIILFQKTNGGWAKNYDVYAILTDAQKDSVKASAGVLNTTFDNGSTFNDGAMVGIMVLLKDIHDGKPQYAFIDDKLRKSLEKAYLEGLDCILKMQINDTGKPTA